MSYNFSLAKPQQHPGKLKSLGDVISEELRKIEVDSVFIFACERGTGNIVTLSTCKEAKVEPLHLSKLSIPKGGLEEVQTMTILKYSASPGCCAAIIGGGGVQICPCD